MPETEHVTEVGRSDKGSGPVYLKALAAGIEDASERAPTEVVRW